MSSSSEESDVRSDAGPSRAKKKYRQQFRDEWLQLQDYRKWLKRDKKSIYKCICTVCDSSLIADLGAIKRHSEGAKHKLRLPALSHVRTIDNIFKSQQRASDDDQRKITELKLSAFMAEHKISHIVMDHLVDLLPKAFPDSKIASNIKLKHTKLQAIINNVIGASEGECLVEDLKREKFSIMVDESTDVASVKTMCVVVKYYDPNLGRIVSRFWDLIQIFDDKKAGTSGDYSATAEKLFNSIIKSFRDKNIPLENTIGFGSDGCNMMMGCHNSVSSRFRQLCPGITVIKCLCHSLHLCASDAFKELPHDAEKLTRMIYNYFKNSSKRQAELKEFQVFTDTNIHKLLRPAQTRWLSLSSVVNRIMEQWDALRLYFDDKWLEDQDCQAIHILLNDHIIKAYFYFLCWMLPKFTRVNVYFQSEDPVIIEAHNKMKELYRELLSLYITPNHLKNTPLDAIDPTDSQHYINLKNIYLGLGVANQVAVPELHVSTEEVTVMKQKCLNFIVKACVGIRKRYSLNDPVLSSIAKLDPDSCLSDNRLQSLSSLFPVLPRLKPQTLNDQQTLDDEWRNLMLTADEQHLNTNQPADVFWHQLSQIKDSNGDNKYHFLPRFMLQVLSLPHSNAECERKFSEINNIKTKQRNCLVTNTIKGNMLAQQAIRRTSENCVNFNPTKEMISRMTAKIYENHEQIVLE
ncbi:unnamed protein product [Parnassius apollo]|uniref:(apollo) hypothetical protein n=1 Tax=Parnassius apollo TaxID=110799 RepID=A0A8S3WIW5_PARAO|nr:unnamed protein product [Parnassius apollo]